MPLNEADTCRIYITPKLRQAGWEKSPHFLIEQKVFTDGRVSTISGKPWREPKKRADYVLNYTRDFMLAVVEAKPEGTSAANGMQQAKEYADILGLKFAYTTNGHDILEFDFAIGTERELFAFPTPDELWNRLKTQNKLSDDAARKLLTPVFLGDKRLRYYQEIAINGVVQAILQGQCRVLLTMATGTGKTIVAFQICWKLWNARWNRIGEYRKPRILFLADRNILIDDPKAKTFAPFGEARFKIENGEISQGREMYFAIYQALARDERRPGLYRQYAPDFFDLIIVDECHRGSARDESNWREILEYFAPAYQLGMTATPLREDNRDSYRYFGNPIYTYSLVQGINDGFLSPYRVHRIITSVDASGWRPSQGQRDRYGREIPDDEYRTGDFERIVVLRNRTEAIAKHLTEFMRRTDRWAKTIVFCVNQEHADEMRRALTNLNQDLVTKYPHYVVRITSNEGEIGLRHLSHFQDIETVTPVIVTTSQLLTTGVDVPTCKNVVIVRIINSMSEFKQIIGRGTRIREDCGKLYFNILDYTGSATRQFADPNFDGIPESTEDVIMDAAGNTVAVIASNETQIDRTYSNAADFADTAIHETAATYSANPTKYYVDGGQVQVISHQVLELDADGKQLSTMQYTDYVTEAREQHMRREQAARVKSQEQDFFAQYNEQARAVLNALLDCNYLPPPKIC